MRLQSLAGADANNNDIKDWVEKRLLSQSRLEIAPTNSAVSPVCLEGRGQYLSMMQCRAGFQPAQGDGELIPIHPGAGHRWYANVPLSSEAATHLEISYQNGAATESHEIIWKPTNLLEANDLTIRKGDSLLLAVAPTNTSSGQVSIIVAGVSNYTTTVAAPVAHRFDQAGTFTVTGTFLRTTATRSITVKVVEASFGGDIAAWAGKRRFWDCADLSAEIVVDPDPRLSLTLVSPEERALQKPTPPPLGLNGRQYSITNDAAEPRMVLARLGTNGPVVASATVQGFRLFNDADTYLSRIAKYEDGSHLIEAGFILSPLLPTVSVGVRVIVSGVTFDDGTVTKILAASDFDATGVCKVRFLRAPGVKTSVCHATKAYENGAVIGWPAQEK